jgi:uncharacterized protein
MSLWFLDSARSGKNAPWRYLMGVLFCLGVWVGGALWIQSLVVVVSGWFSANLNEPVGQFLFPLAGSDDFNKIATFVINVAPFLFLGIGVGITIKLFHGRSLKSLVSPAQQIRWWRVLAGFGVWFGILIVQSLIEFALNPRAFAWNFEPVQWLIFLPIALLLIPIQTSAEEVFFRGYLLQGLGLIVRSPVALTFLSSLPFAFVHLGNPEMQRGAVWIALTYFTLAVFFTTITLQDNGLELALGVHGANNLFIVLLINTQDSALQSPAVWIQTVPSNPRLTLLMVLLGAIGFWWIFLGITKRFPHKS